MSRCPTPEKKAYRTVEPAVLHAHGLRVKGGSVDIEPYRCRCGSWHVGHNAAALTRRIRLARRVGRA